MRIVSFLPSATEIVCALGLQDSLVGVSHECDFPASIQDLPRVTSTRMIHTDNSHLIDQQVREMVSSGASLYNLEREVLLSLAPDLVVTQSLCDVCAVSERDVLEVAAQLPGLPQVVRLNPTSLSEVLDGLRQVGQAAHVPWQPVVARLDARIQSVIARSRSWQGTRPRVLLLEWIDPPFSAGHWNPELVEMAGGQECFGIAGSRSRQLDWEEVVTCDPDIMVIACCGLSIDRTMEDLPTLVSYRQFGKLKCIQDGQVYLVDGSQLFNRPGPRLVDSLELLAHTLIPELHPLPEYLEPAVRMTRRNAQTQ